MLHITEKQGARDRFVKFGWDNLGFAEGGLRFCACGHFCRFVSDVIIPPEMCCECGRHHNNRATSKPMRCWVADQAIWKDMPVVRNKEEPWNIRGL